MLVEFLEEREWGIFNGSIKGVERGEYTFTGGKENTVIDYIIGNEDVAIISLQPYQSKLISSLKCT